MSRMEIFARRWMWHFMNAPIFFCSNSNNKHGKVGKDKSYTWYPLAVVWFQRHLYEKHKQTKTKTNNKYENKCEDKKKHNLNHWTKKCATDKHKHRKKYRPENSARKIDTCRCAFVLFCLLCHIKEWWWHKTLPNCSIFYTSVDHNP